MSIYVSTTCLGYKKVTDVLRKYKDEGIKNIELGSTHIYEKNIENYIENYLSDLNCNFIIHNYFPPPQKEFVMNLASANKEILDLSIKQVKKAIDLCNKLGSPLYTLHAGFRINLRPKELGKKIEADEIIRYNVAFNIFVNSLKEILNYTTDKNVKVAIELNVPSGFNIVNGKNKFLLLCEYWEIENLFKKINSLNLGLLLDLGHLKVASHWLKFNKDWFVDKVANKVFEIHIHENNGRQDLHLNIDENSWCLDVINKKIFRNTPICLEAHNLTIRDIKKSYNLINNKLRVYED